jgi:hypothetical protein
MHSQSVPSLFFKNRTGALHGDTLGQMYPFSIISFSYSLRSTSSSVLILYGILDDGTSPGVSSIKKLISLLGGRPGTSSGNMSLYSLNMGWSSRCGLSFSTDSNTYMACKEHPFLQYFFI